MTRLLLMLATALGVVYVAGSVEPGAISAQGRAALERVVELAKGVRVVSPLGPPEKHPAFVVVERPPAFEAPKAEAEEPGPEPEPHAAPAQQTRPDPPARSVTSVSGTSGLTRSAAGAVRGRLDRVMQLAAGAR